MRTFLPWTLVAATAALACAQSPSRIGENTGPSGTTKNTVASLQGSFDLGPEPLSVSLKLADAWRAPATSERVSLVIDGIEMLRPGASFEVYLDPPESEALDSRHVSYVGEIAIFGKPGETPPSSRSLDVTMRVRALNEHRRLDPTQPPLRVVFRSSALGLEAEAAPALRFRKLTLEVR